jgi:hypothetical protein
MRLASGIAQGTTVAVTARLANAMPVRPGRQPPPFAVVHRHHAILLVSDSTKKCLSLKLQSKQVRDNLAFARSPTNAKCAIRVAVLGSVAIGIEAN